jgi:hypothetical protein
MNYKYNSNFTHICPLPSLQIPNNDVFGVKQINVMVEIVVDE